MKYYDAAKVVLVMTRQEPAPDDIGRIMKLYKDRVQEWKIVKNTPVKQIDWGLHPRAKDDGWNFIDTQPEVVTAADVDERYPYDDWRKYGFCTPYADKWAKEIKHAPVHFIDQRGNWVEHHSNFDWIENFYERYIKYHPTCWVTALECTGNNNNLYDIDY